MARTAERVHADPVAVERLSALCLRLPQEQCVELRFADGRRVSGVVLATPSLQTFVDPSGDEGVNALLRLDDVDGSGRSLWYWVDEIADVAHCTPAQPDVQRGRGSG